MASKSLKLLFALIFLFSFTGLQAQEADRERLDMLNINLNSTFLLGSQGSFEQKFYSHGYDLHFMYDHPMPRSPISIGIGIGLSHQRVYSNAAVVWTDSNSTIWHTFRTEAIDTTIRRSAFNMNYYEIPAEIRYRTKPDERGHPWKIAVGAKIGFKLNSKQLLVDDNGHRFTTTAFPHTARIRGVGTFRVGYGKISLYGAYQFTTLFHEGQGDELYPFSAGVTLSLF